jgi:hypothetical protein
MDHDNCVKGQRDSEIVSNALTRYDVARIGLANAEAAVQLSISRGVTPLNLRTIKALVNEQVKTELHDYAKRKMEIWAILDMPDKYNNAG